MIRVLPLVLLLAACTQIKERAEKIEPKIPAPTFRISYPTSYFIGLPWCAATSAMLKMMQVERRLTNGEVWRLMGACYVPLVGGYLVEKMYGHRPEWNEYPIDIAGPIDQVPEYMRR